MRKGLYILLLMFGTVATATAQFHKTTDGRVNHFITFSLAGGESNYFSAVRGTDNSPYIKDKIGADGIFMLSYEMRKEWFIFGFGAQADYDYTRQEVGEFADVFSRKDREEEDINYAYRFSGYGDEQHVLQVSVPLYVGANIGSLLYVLAGAKVSIPMLSLHKTTTDLTTDGTYLRFIHTIQDAPTYGYYAPDEYEYSSSFDAPEIKISPFAEFGFRIPVHSRSGRVGMRLGLYAEYGIPLSINNKMMLVDYSSVDKSPFTQSQEQLRSSIVFNSPLNTNIVAKKLSQLSVGLRWSVLINVTPPEHICMCDRDF